MRFDFQPAQLFIDHLQGKTDLDTVLTHPAYQAVFSHNALLGSGLGKEDVAKAIRGEASPYYGLQSIHDNLPQVERLLAIIREAECHWLQEIESALSRLFAPQEYADIVICPILGYDAGIGHQGHSCLNLNLPYYFDNPREFLYLAIHESFHAVYENWQPLPSLNQITKDPRGAYLILLQNEGYAVWAPLSLRKDHGHVGSVKFPVLKDYVVVADRQLMTEHVNFHDRLLRGLEREELNFNQFLESAFGNSRLVYRVGCKLVERIEEEYGLSAVRDAVRLTPETYYARYNHLLDKYRSQ